MNDPKPFLKWAGGKRRLLHQIAPILPKRIQTYYEPFLGGGALFFHLAGQRRFERAVLSDINGELIETYRIVRDELDELIDALEVHAAFATSAEYYYAVRAQKPEELSAIMRAARFLFLNRTCFNGLYRVNRSGQFNVPYGKYKRPNVVNADVLRAASKALQGTTLIEGDFETTVATATRGDAVYFDPPYIPASPTASFTAYYAKNFGPPDHMRLLETYRMCGRRGVDAILSNTDVPTTRWLYAGLQFKTVQAPRTINAVATKRGPVNELLVVGFREAA
ncbi:MAG: DNA adenine methylase [Myxococcota bacterium]